MPRTTSNKQSNKNKSNPIVLPPTSVLVKNNNTLFGFIKEGFGFGIGSTIASNMARGVTAPGTEQFDQDYAKMDLTTDVRNIGPETNTPSGGGGITTIQSYAPLSNTSTGDNTADSIRKRLEDLLVQRPTSYVTPTASQLSNYNLLDLVNLRR